MDRKITDYKIPENYIIFIDENGNVCAEKDGNIDFRGIDATKVIQYAIDDVGTNGGKIVSNWSYMFSLGSKLNFAPNIAFEGFNIDFSNNTGNIAHQDCIGVPSRADNVKIINCQFKNFFPKEDNAIFSIFAKSTLFDSCWFHDCGPSNPTTSDSTTAIYFGAVGTKAQNGIVRSCLFERITSDAAIGTTANNVYIHDCIFISNKLALNGSISKNIVFENNYVSGGNGGINISTGGTGDFIIIRNNKFENIIQEYQNATKASPINIVNSTNVIIDGNYIIQNPSGGSAGIMIQGNSTGVIIKNCIIDQTTGQAIYIVGTSYDDIIIDDNRITPRSGYGIRIDASSGRIVIKDNILPVVSPIFNSGAFNVIFKNNKNYKTETDVLSNTFSIDTVGIKTVTIPHGLAITPNVQDCHLTIIETTAVDDWAFNLLKIVSTDATNVMIKINVSMASKTVGSTARLALIVCNP